MPKTSLRVLPLSMVTLFCSLALLCTLGAASHAADTPRKGSLKKGFCVTARKDATWSEKLQALNAKWFYTWGANKPEKVPEGIEYVPMIWGKFGAEKQHLLSQLSAQAKQGEFEYLMGFNEPDQHSQSNISVKKAIELWPHLEATGLPLGSPGCVHPDRQWMTDFMQEVDKRKLRVDYICVHSYGGPSAKGLVERLRKVHEMYKRPIWITEFAVGDWQAKEVSENKHPPKKIGRFMRELLPMLEDLDFVHRYAWFSASPDSAALGNSALFNKDGTLTELGEIYSSF